MCIIKSKYSREKEGSREDKVNIECERERKRERSEENGRNLPEKLLLHVN